MKFIRKLIIGFFASIGLIATIALVLFVFTYINVSQVSQTPLTIQPSLGWYTFTQDAVFNQTHTIQISHSYHCPLSCTVQQTTRLITNTNIFSVSIPLNTTLTSIPIVCNSTCDTLAMQTAYPVQGLYTPTPEYVTFVEQFTQLKNQFAQLSFVQDSLRYRQSILAITNPPIATVQLIPIDFAQKAFDTKQAVDLTQTIQAMTDTTSQLEQAYLTQTALLKDTLALYTKVFEGLSEYENVSVPSAIYDDISQALTVLTTHQSFAVRQSYAQRIRMKLLEHHAVLVNVSVSNQSCSMNISQTCMKRLLTTLNSTITQYTTVLDKQTVLNQSIQQVQQDVQLTTSVIDSTIVESQKSVVKNTTKRLYVLLHGFGLQSTPVHAYSMQDIAQLISRTTGAVNLGVYDWSNPYESYDAFVSGEQMTSLNANAQQTTTRVTARSNALLHLPDTGAIISLSYYTQPAWFSKKASVEDFAVSVHTQLSAIRQLVDEQTQVVLVGYSLGGLVARLYTGLFQPAFVTDIITIYTPHQGIDQATAVLCESVQTAQCRQIFAQSPFMIDLARLQTPPVTAFYDDSCEMSQTTGDGVVTKQLAQLDSATMIRVSQKPCSVEVHTQPLNNVSQLFAEFAVFFEKRFSQ
jgi:triacylglycerol esterase/lipase EstA (alpha/beta hydrolase family)